MALVTKKDVKRAIENVCALGDTDVFPFPFETWLFKEAESAVVDIVCEIDANFTTLIDQAPPQFESTLAPAGYTGFRWVTQIDPFWNLYLLAMIVAEGKNIEAARIPESENIIHSYRFNPTGGPHVFKKGIGWASFMETSLQLSHEYEYVVSTDISEFYRRINHHRIENSLEHVISNQIPDRIISILSIFSNGSSYGIPIGGPAARLLSEITINQIDWLLRGHEIRFVRFADDFHIFTKSQDEAYAALQFLSQSLITNQGLTLQKSKTRIMTSSEFQNSYPKHLLPTPPETESTLESETVKLLKLSLNYDPYSSTAADDYAALQRELGEIDIVGLLTAEAQKSQINISVARRIVATISHLDPPLRLSAIRTLLDNKEQFFPIMSQVLIMIGQISSSASAADQATISTLIRSAITSKSHVFGLDLHLAFAIRILAESGAESDMLLMQSKYENVASFVKKDILLAYAKHRYWYPLSDVKGRFGSMTPWEQRAYLFSSYSLGDEGKHWRDSIALNFLSVDKAMRAWAGSLKTSGKLLVRL